MGPAKETILRLERKFSRVRWEDAIYTLGQSFWSNLVINMMKEFLGALRVQRVISSNPSHSQHLEELSCEIGTDDQKT